jgi:hypothetical protein
LISKAFLTEERDNTAPKGQRYLHQARFSIKTEKTRANRNIEAAIKTLSGLLTSERVRENKGRGDTHPRKVHLVTNSIAIPPKKTAYLMYRAPSGNCLLFELSDVKSKTKPSGHNHPQKALPAITALIISTTENRIILKGIPRPIIAPENAKVGSIFQKNLIGKAGLNRP